MGLGVCRAKGLASALRWIWALGTPVMVGKKLVLSLLKVDVENRSMRYCFSLGIFSGVGGKGILVVGLAWLFTTGAGDWFVEDTAATAVLMG